VDVYALLSVNVLVVDAFSDTVVDVLIGDDGM
jgi:hypothetical protein